MRKNHFIISLLFFLSFSATAHAKECAIATNNGVVTYAFKKSFTDIYKYMDKKKAKQRVRDALNSWSKVIEVDFVEVKPGQKPRLNFITHNKNQTSYAYRTKECTKKARAYVAFNKRKWFKKGDSWTLNLIASHEIGHILGLGHYKEGKPVLDQLSSEDIRRVRKLYKSRAIKK